jgi:hypothetical protein
VEYTFKNSASEKVRTIILNQYNFIIQSQDNEERIPYVNVTSVKLSKTSGKIFKITISQDGRGPIVITNKYYLPDGAVEDRSRQYATFVRVLHYHLKEKSSPVYTTGFSVSLLMAWILISAFASFFISFISEYLGASLLNPFLQSLLLTMVIVMIVVALNRGRLPKTYSPGEIPLQLLP